MLQTKIKKVLAIAALASLAMTGAANTNATQIGTGSVTGSGAFDAVIDWNDIFGAGSSASGAVEDIKIRARVLPILNMEISTEEIDLGDLIPGVPGTGELDIEIGTNAISGVSITARSQNAGLTHTDDPTLQINNLIADSVAESYTWASTPNATDDSSAAAFAATGLATATEINDNTTEHTVYTTNRPESTNLVDDVKFNVETTTTFETPAGIYEDFVTFTVTANF